MWSKQRVLVWGKALEVAAMAALVGALVAAQSGAGWPMLAVLFVMAAQSTFFSPAKYGILPELLPPRDLSRANGLLEMSTFVAIVVGSVAGGELFERWRGDAWTTGVAVLALAIAGLATSRRIPHTPAANPGRPFSVNPLHEIGEGVARLTRDRNLLMTVVGISFFWFLGALIQLAVLPSDAMSCSSGRPPPPGSSRRWPSASGSAASWPAGCRETGSNSCRSARSAWAPAPWCSWRPRLTTGSAAASLAVTGFAGGWFAVPLHALLQQKPGDGERGRVLATNNVANTVGILLASAVLYLLGERAGMSASQILGLAGALTLAATVYALWSLPEFVVRLTLWLLTHTVYRMRIVGQQHVPLREPALLVCNHVSHADGLLVGACVQRFIRFMVYYVRKCSPEQFATLRMAITGAEKLREQVAQAFRDKYGLDLFEGYGCTEMAPVVSVNVPDRPDAGQRGYKPGTVGHPIPGVVAKVVDVDTGEPVDDDTEGLLLVRGANRMMGYLNAPEQTRQVLCDGWYVTGDVAAIDDEGFIRLTDRLSRFSKIGGEMVPHVRIEEAVASMVRDAACLVTAIPDETKGERLVVLHTDANVPADVIWARLTDLGLPKLWSPRRTDTYYVQMIPVLGTGKVDLKGARALALELTAGSRERVGAS